MYSDSAVSESLSSFKKDPAQTVIFGFADVNVAYLAAYEGRGIHANSVFARNKVGESEHAFLSVRTLS
jgi:hypothetical protein